jgi:hypothetical protein
MSLDNAQTEAGCRSRLVPRSTGYLVSSIPADTLSHIGPGGPKNNQDIEAY